MLQYFGLFLKAGALHEDEYSRTKDVGDFDTARLVQSGDTVSYEEELFRWKRDVWMDYDLLMSTDMGCTMDYLKVEVKKFLPFDATIRDH